MVRSASALVRVEPPRGFRIERWNGTLAQRSAAQPPCSAASAENTDQLAQQRREVGEMSAVRCSVAVELTTAANFCVAHAQY